MNRTSSNSLVMSTVANNSLAIYGGTFNPVHLAHIELALRCQKEFQFKRFHILPSSSPAYKEQPLAGEHRLAMLRLAFAAYPQFVIDERELQRQGMTYTIDTVHELRAQEGADMPIFFIVGSDSWLNFNSWEAWQDILDAVNIIIVDRAAYILDDASQAQQLRDELTKRELVDVREFLTTPKGQIFKYAMPLMPISSTYIRALIKERASTQHILLDTVRAYIEQHHLYQ